MLESRIVVTDPEILKRIKPKTDSSPTEEAPLKIPLAERPDYVHLRLPIPDRRGPPHGHDDGPDGSSYDLVNCSYY